MKLSGREKRSLAAGEEGKNDLENKLAEFAKKLAESEKKRAESEKKNAKSEMTNIGLRNKVILFG